LPTRPAFFAARITSPTKGLWTLAAPVAVLDAPGPDAQIVMTQHPQAIQGDGARSIETLGLFVESASGGC
jgi:hypothetical protein